VSSLKSVNEFARANQSTGSKAIELDPNFASAYGRAAFCYFQRKARGWLTNRDEEIAERVRLANRAVRLTRDDAVALCWGGYALAYLVHDLEGSAAFIDRALALNPNDHAAWALGGWVMYGRRPRCKRNLTISEAFGCSHVSGL
jgi:tetratricopeptide (TPR) repeat protein